MIGGLFLVLTLVSFGLNRPDSDRGLLGEFIIYGSTLLMLLPLTLFLASRHSKSVSIPNKVS